MRIVLADDSSLLREGLLRLLDDLGHEVVAAVGSATELIAAVDPTHPPDLVLSDIRMPPRGEDDGLQACLELRERVPGLPVVLLSQHAEGAYARELLAERTGAVGYLLKDRVTSLDTLGQALDTVAGGGTVLDPVLASALVARRADPLESLTPREREVLTLMAEGRSNAGIQEALVLSAGAVEKHITSVFQKLNLPAATDDHRRVLAVLTFLGVATDRRGSPPRNGG